MTSRDEFFDPVTKRDMYPFIYTQDSNIITRMAERSVFIYMDRMKGPQCNLTTLAVVSPTCLKRCPSQPAKRACSRYRPTTS